MRRIYAILLFTAVMLAPSLARAQKGYYIAAPDCDFGFQYSVVSGVISSTTPLSAQRLPLSFGGGNVVGFDNRTTGCTSWSLWYNAEGVGSLSIETDFAPSTNGIPGSWTIFPGSQPLTAITQSQVSFFLFKPWVSVNLNSAGGTGIVIGRIIGWRNPPSSDINTGAITVAGSSTAVDPCQSSGVAKSSVSVSITTATTTQIVAASGTTAIYVCGYNIASNSTATTNTFQFEFGTGGTCGAGTTVLSGAMANGVNAVSFNMSGGATLMKTTASQGLCIVSTVGTGPSIAGFVTFVQQ
jgi:hypothetical protein